MMGLSVVLTQRWYEKVRFIVKIKLKKTYIPPSLVIPLLYNPKLLKMLLHMKKIIRRHLLLKKSFKL